MSPIEISEVVRAYNKTRIVRGKRTVKLSSDRTRKSAAKFILWCRKHEVPTVPFMESVTEHMRTLFPLNNVGNETTLKFWRETLEGEWLQAHAFKATAEPIATMELDPIQERIKERYQAQRQLCLSRREFTGGFSPLSSHCRGCPEQQRCR